MISCGKAVAFLFFAFSTSAPGVSGHAIPKDLDMDKFRTELEELRANDSSDGDFLDGHEFIAPGPDDARSPCPFINIFANHGFINRNGRDIPAFDISNLAETLFDMPKELFEPAINTSILFGQAVVQENGDTLINLDSLWDRPGIERDASMVYQNPGMASFSDLPIQKFRRTIDTDLLDNLLCKNSDSDVVTLKDINSFLYDRILDSRRDDPFFLWGNGSRFAAALQYPLPVLILGESKDDFTEAPKEYIKTLFLEERFPDGYMPRSLRFPDFNVTKYLSDFGSALNDLVITSLKAEAADLVGDSDDASNLRGHVSTDTM